MPKTEIAIKWPKVDVVKENIHLHGEAKLKMISSYKERYNRSLKDLFPKSGQVSIFYDRMFKAMFLNTKRVIFPAYFLSYLLDMEYEDILKEIEYQKNEFDMDTVGDKASRGDFVVKLRDTLINVECNNTCRLSRNLGYMDKLSAKDIKEGEAYNYHRVIAVNLNNYYREGRGIYDINYRTMKDGTVLVYKVSLDIYVPKIYEKYYNEGEKSLNKFERFVIVMTTTDEKLAEELARGDEVMEKYVREAKVTRYSDPDLVEAYDHVEDMIEGRIMIERELAEEKIEKAEKQAKNAEKQVQKAERQVQKVEKQVQKAREEKYETAKSLFREGMSLENILKHIKFTSTEIEKLKLML